MQREKEGVAAGSVVPVSPSRIFKEMVSIPEANSQRTTRSRPSNQIKTVPSFICSQSAFSFLSNGPIGVPRCFLSLYSSSFLLVANPPVFQGL